MNYDSEAIRKAYPNAVVIHDDVGVFEQTGTDENDDAILKEIVIDQTLVDAARETLDAESVAMDYIRKRTGSDGTTDTIYLTIEQQLDMQYWDLINGTTTWKDHITAVKTKYPKPSN